MRVFDALWPKTRGGRAGSFGPGLLRKPGDVLLWGTDWTRASAVISDEQAVELSFGPAIDFAAQ
jgi:hypothetical protein